MNTHDDQLSNANVGVTTRQMREAPKGAIYIWPNSELGYPKRLAEVIGRKDDLYIVSIFNLDPQAVYGQDRKFVLDHACITMNRSWPTKAVHAIAILEERHQLVRARGQLPAVGRP